MQQEALCSNKKSYDPSLVSVSSFSEFCAAERGPDIHPLCQGAEWAFVYDDIGLILNNPSLDSMHAIWIHFILEPVSFTNRFRGIGGSFYRPILWLSITLI